MKRIFTILFISFASAACAQQDANANYQSQIDSLNSQLNALHKDLSGSQMKAGMNEAMQKLNEAMKSIDSLRLEIYIDSNGRRQHTGYFKFPDSANMMNGFHNRNFMPPVPPVPRDIPDSNGRMHNKYGMLSDSLQMQLDELSQQLKELNGQLDWQNFGNYPPDQDYKDSMSTDEDGDSVTVIRLGKSSRIIIKHPGDNDYQYNYDDDKNGNNYHYHYHYNNNEDSNNDDNNNDNNESHERDQSNLATTWLGFDLGINTYLNNGNSNLPSQYEPLTLDHCKSIVVNLGIIAQELNLDNHGLFLNYGLGFEFNNFRFNTQQVLVPRIDTVGFSDYSASLTKYKLADAYIVIPIALTLRTSKRYFHSFLLSAGPEFGYLLGAHTKMVSESNGKVKVHDDFNLSPFKYGLTGRVGFGPITFWATYYFSPLFSNGINPNLTPISFGIGLSSW